MPPRKVPLLTALAATAALAAGAPAADARPGQSPRVPARSAMAGFSGWSVPAMGSGACGSTSGAEVGQTAGNTYQVCVGAGLSFIGPAVGQVAAVIGPTIISPGFTGNVIVSAGSVGTGR